MTQLNGTPWIEQSNIADEIPSISPNCAKNSIRIPEVTSSSAVLNNKDRMWLVTLKYLYEK